VRTSLSRIGARMRAFLGPDIASVRQGLAALLVCAAADLVAGLTLGRVTHTLNALPGLLVLIPAAIGLRGNIFGALGSRLGTAIHAGTFSVSRRRDTVLGQNVLASLALSLGVSAALALLARTVAVAFGVGKTISIADFMVISVLGGTLASLVVLLLTVGVAAAAVRFGWDLDNAAGPVVTAAGDLVTLPSLVLATNAVSIRIVTPVTATVLAIGSTAALVVAARTHYDALRRIVRESTPVLLAASTLSIVAGLTLEKRRTGFHRYPALLVLVPPLLSLTGAVAEIVASRISSKLHLGVVAPTPVPQRAARYDFLLGIVLSVPIFAMLAGAVEFATDALGLASPGAVRMLEVSMAAGLSATALALGIGYYTSIAAFRVGLDPDNHGIPIISASTDLLATIALIVTIAAVGLT
jgi:mgtE-like transporter